MKKGEWGKIKAFFDLETEEGFTMKGFKLVQGINGLFVGFLVKKVVMRNTMILYGLIKS